MVRLKTRWLLVRIDYAVEIPTRNDLARAIRDNLLQCSGVAAAGAAYDTQVRWCDPFTRLALIRIPREFCAMVRASLTLMTTLPTTSSSSNGNSSASSNSLQRVVLNVLSVHGSARTAKIKCIREVRRLYRDQINILLLTHQQQQTNNNSNKPMKSTASSSSRKRDRSNDDVDAETAKLCRALEDTLEQVVVIDF